jgi:hypothetical protein
MGQSGDWLFWAVVVFTALSAGIMLFMLLATIGGV